MTLSIDCYENMHFMVRSMGISYDCGELLVAALVSL